MKLKEDKGMSLIVFTVILAILVILLVVGIVYLLRNPIKEIKENLENENLTNIDYNKKENNNINTTVNEDTSNNFLENGYKSLKELALLKISPDKLTKTEEIYEYNFNEDYTNEKITVKQIEEEYNYNIYYEDQEIITGVYNFNLYVVDLDESDKVFDLILSTISDGGGITDYYIFKNKGKIFEELKYTTKKAITNDSEGNNLYLNQKGKFALVGDVETYFDKIITDSYYEIKNDSIYNIKIENLQLNEKIIVKKEFLNFTTDYNKVGIEFNNVNPDLELGTKLEIIEWVIGPEPSFQEIIKVKLESGEIGYIYETYA